MRGVSDWTLHDWLTLTFQAIIIVCLIWIIIDRAKGPKE